MRSFFGFSKEVVERTPLLQEFRSEEPTGKGVSILLDGQRRWTSLIQSLLRLATETTPALAPVVRSRSFSTAKPRQYRLMPASLTVDRHDMTATIASLVDQAALFEALSSQRGNGSLNLAMATPHTNREAVSSFPFLLACVWGSWMRCRGILTDLRHT